MMDQKLLSQKLLHVSLYWVLFDTTICSVTPAVLAGQQLSHEIVTAVEFDQQVTNVSRPVLTADDQTGEVYFDFTFNGLELRTFLENEPGLLRVTSPGTDDEFFIRVSTIGDPVAGTANQFVTIMDENKSPVETYFLTHTLSEDANGNFLGNSITVVGTNLPTKTSVWYDATDRTLSLSQVEEANHLVSLTNNDQNLSLNMVGGTNLLLANVLGANDNGLPQAISEFAAGGLGGAFVLLVIFAVAGVYTVFNGRVQLYHRFR